jgi:hypothetical protein
MCKHFIGTMRLHHLASILSILLRTTVIALVLYPVCANAAEEQATARATQEESPPKPETTTTTSSKSVSSSSQGTALSEQLEQVVVTSTYTRGVSPASPLITIASLDIENSGASTAGEVLRELPESLPAPSVAVDQPGTAAQVGQGNDESQQKSEELQEVVVTGTHIRGVSPPLQANECVAAA